MVAAAIRYDVARYHVVALSCSRVGKGALM
jgi:hypothetical protein